MTRRIFHVSEKTWNWAIDYVGRKRIRGPKGNISVSELIRRLLSAEMIKDKKKNNKIRSDEV